MCMYKNINIFKKEFSGLKQLFCYIPGFCGLGIGQGLARWFHCMWHCLHHFSVRLVGADGWGCRGLPSQEEHLAGVAGGLGLVIVGQNAHSSMAQRSSALTGCFKRPERKCKMPLNVLEVHICWIPLIEEANETNPDLKRRSRDRWPSLIDYISCIHLLFVPIIDHTIQAIL